MRDEQRAEEVAAAARDEIDALAAKVGTSPVVKEDVLTNCVPEQDDSGSELIYTLHVTVQPGALATLQGELAEEYANQGWTVKPTPDGARFTKDGISMGAFVWEEDGRASVGGTGGCVK